jgi:hypothetical protein
VAFGEKTQRAGRLPCEPCETARLGILVPDLRTAFPELRNFETTKSLSANDIRAQEKVTTMGAGLL